MRSNFIVAAAVASVIPMSMVSATTVFENDDSIMNIGGRAEVRGNFSEANKNDDNSNSYQDMSRVRLNVDGTTNISENVDFFGKYEFELTESEDGSGDMGVNTRYLYAGVETSHGNVYYGHQDNAVTYLTNFTDMSEVYSGYINEYLVSTADRAKNVLRYEITTEQGFTFQVDGNFNSDSESAQSNGYGAVLAYKIPIGLEIGIGYSASNETYDNSNDTDRSDAFIAAAKYTNDNGIWAAVTYQGGNISYDHVKNAEYNAADAFLGYTFGDNAINLSYSYFSADELDQLDINFASIEYARYFGNVAFYGAYKINFVEQGKGGEGDNDQNEVMLGMRYSF